MKHFYSCESAAAAVGIRPRWFRYVADVAGEAPHVFEGQMRIRHFWVHDQVERIRKVQAALAARKEYQSGGVNRTRYEEWES